MELEKSLEEEAEDFASDVLPSRLLVIHDPGRRRHHDETKLSRWEKIGRPLLHLIDGDVESGRDDAAFIQSSRQVDDDLASSVIIDTFELSDVAVLHHHRQELDDYFGVGAD